MENNSCGVKNLYSYLLWFCLNLYAFPLRNYTMLAVLPLVFPGTQIFYKLAPMCFIECEPLLPDWHCFRQFSTITIASEHRVELLTLTYESTCTITKYYWQVFYFYFLDNPGLFHEYPKQKSLFKDNLPMSQCSCPHKYMHVVCMWYFDCNRLVNNWLYFIC